MTTEQAIPITVFKGHTPFDWYPWSSSNIDEPPIATREIKEALNDTSSTTEYNPTIVWTRQQHIHRIAFFVKNGWERPITIDTGIPSLGRIPLHPIMDGHHRIAAAIFLKYNTIQATPHGDLDIFEQLSKGTSWDLILLGTV